MFSPCVVFAAESISEHRAKFQQYDQADAAFDMLKEGQALIDLSNGAVWAHYDFARALQKAGMTAQAIAEYDKVLATNPHDEDALLGRTQCLLAVGRTRDAVEAFESMTKQQPDNIELWLNLASAYSQYHDDLATETVCEKILKKLHPTRSEAARAARLLANARLHHFDFSGALAAAKQLLALAPEEPDAYIFVAREQLRYDKNPEIYRRLTNQAATHLQGKKDPFYSLAVMFDGNADRAHREHKTQSAIEWQRLAKLNYEIALQGIQSSDPDWMNSKLGLASLDMKLHDFPGALRNAQDVLRLAPKHPHATQIAEHASTYINNDLAGRMKRTMQGKSL